VQNRAGHTGSAGGPRAVHKMLTLRGARPRETTARLPPCADIDGFSLHAAVRVDAAAAPLQHAFELTQPE